MSKINKSIYKPVDDKAYGKRPKAPFREGFVSDEELAEHTKSFWEKIEDLKKGLDGEKCLAGLAFVATERGLGVTMYGRGDALAVGFDELLANKDVLSAIIISSVLKYKEEHGLGNPEDYLQGKVE